MKNEILEAARNRLLIAAHRGSAGGNIPCNSMASYETALFHGADILEIDITKSKDGELFVFHPGLEHIHLRSERLIGDMTAAEVRELRYCNGDGTKTTQGVSTLDEIFECFGRRCFINLDKFWDNIAEITACVRRHHMQDRVIAKSFPADECVDLLEKFAPDIPYLPFVWNEDDCTEELLQRNIRYIGTEVHFDRDDSPVASDEYLDSMHKKDLIIWANAIVYNYKTVESAGHTDDISVTGDPGNGWGWLAKKDFNILQTDWVLPMRMYLKENGFLK